MHVGERRILQSTALSVSCECLTLNKKKTTRITSYKLILDGPRHLHPARTDTDDL